MIGRWLLAKMAKQQLKELKDWNESLTGVGSDELGFIVALTSEWRHKYADHGVNLLDPMLAVMNDDGLAPEMARVIRKLQKSGKQGEVPGLMVWLHSVRSFINPQLRVYARQMWGELARGFENAPVASYQFRQSTGVNLRLSDFDVFPKGLEPENY